MRALTVAIALLLVASPAVAQKRDYRVAMVPLSALGSDASSATLDSLSQAIAGKIRTLRSFALIPKATLDKALQAANRADLSSCDGSDACLVELGRIAGADYTVYGEMGGLGSAQVVYLKLVGVKAGKDLRATTLEFEGDAPTDAAVEAAVMRLLSPNLYTGTLQVQVDVKGATIYIDGERAGESPSKAIPLPVGSHAVRITHPEFRDFVRFVDIEFKQTVPIRADLQQFPVIASQIRKNPEKAKAIVAQPTTVRETPWYRKWYTVAGVGTVAFVASAIVFANLTGIDSDATRTVDLPAP